MLQRQILIKNSKKGQNFHLKLIFLFQSLFIAPRKVEK